MFFQLNAFNVKQPQALNKALMQHWESEHQTMRLIKLKLATLANMVRITLFLPAQIDWCPHKVALNAMKWFWKQTQMDTKNTLFYFMKTYLMHLVWIKFYTYPSICHVSIIVISFLSFHTGWQWILSHQWQLIFVFVCVCMCFVLPCLPVSHPQQRPSGHYSSAGCHGEMFPAWTGFAT